MTEAERVQQLVDQLFMMGEGMALLYKSELVPDKSIDRLWDTIWLEPVYEALDRHHISHEWDLPENHLTNLAQALFESRG